jgi:hypothetical protein
MKVEGTGHDDQCQRCEYSHWMASPVTWMIFLMIFMGWIVTYWALVKITGKFFVLDRQFGLMVSALVWGALYYKFFWDQQWIFGDQNTAFVILNRVKGFNANVVQNGKTSTIKQSFRVAFTPMAPVLSPFEKLYLTVNLQRTEPIKVGPVDIYDDEGNVLKASVQASIRAIRTIDGILAIASNEVSSVVSFYKNMITPALQDAANDCVEEIKTVLNGQPMDDKSREDEIKRLIKKEGISLEKKNASEILIKHPEVLLRMINSEKYFGGAKKTENEKVSGYYLELATIAVNRDADGEKVRRAKVLAKQTSEAIGELKDSGVSADLAAAIVTGLTGKQGITHSSRTIEIRGGDKLTGSFFFSDGGADPQAIVAATKEPDKQNKGGGKGGKRAGK